MLTIFLVYLNMEHCAFVLKHVWVAACVCTLCMCDWEMGAQPMLPCWHHKIGRVFSVPAMRRGTDYIF